jgi:hypothetical protein
MADSPTHLRRPCSRIARVCSASWLTSADGAIKSSCDTATGANAAYDSVDLMYRSLPCCLQGRGSARCKTEHRSRSDVTRAETKCHQKAYSFRRDFQACLGMHGLFKGIGDRVPSLTVIARELEGDEKDLRGACRRRSIGCALKGRSTQVIACCVQEL